MNRNNRIVVPTELEASIEATIDVKHSDDDHESVRGVLDAASTDVTSNEEEGKSENAPPKLNVALRPMMSFMSEIVDEGLGDEFDDTPWVPPTLKRFLTATYFVLAMLSIPSFLFAVTGQGFKEVESSNILALTMVGNIGYPCVKGAMSAELTAGCDSTTGDTQNVLGGELTHLEVSYCITAFELVGSVFFIWAILYWRIQTDAAVKRVDTNKVTATDYAVYVEGLPKTAERNDIGQFFSDLYQLEAPDWKGRPPYKHAQAVFNVDNTEDKWYMGKWVAEVCVVRKVGRELKAYKDKKGTVLQLKKKRAEAKMYNKGTPLHDGKGANPAKFTEAVQAADQLGGDIAKTTDKIMDTRKDIYEKQACVGCFIIFNHPLSLHRCMEDFSSTGMFVKCPKELMFQGTRKLKITKAPEPDNIIWENLEFPKWKRAFRQIVTGLLSLILLAMALALILLATGIKDLYAQTVPRISYCDNEVPALYFGDYSKSLAVADELKLVRPDMSYRWDEDQECQAILDDKGAVYMVYTIEEREESYRSPVLNYSLSACEFERGTCPDYRDRLHCPCASSSNFQICRTLECSDPDQDPGGICGEFVFITVSGCYCHDRFEEERIESGIFSALSELRAVDWDICGSFALTWAFVKVINVIISLLTPIINGVLEFCLKALISWEKNISDDETETRLMYRVFQTQFVNTGIIFLLVYGTAPSGFETPSFLKDLWIFAGPYNDFTREWQAVAGTGLMGSYILTAIGPHFLPLINIFFLSKWRIGKATEAIKNDEGKYVMQSELNNVFVGPVFNFTTRYSYLLTLLFVTMAFSGGMFALNMMSFLFFFATYWIDKIGILRFYRRPPHREDALQRQVNNTLPWALLIHLCLTCWFLGTESIMSEVISQSLTKDTSYESAIETYEKKFGILATRLIRTNVFPLFLLTAGVFVWCVLEFAGKFFPVLAFLNKGIWWVGQVFTGRKRKGTLAVMRPGRPNQSRWTSEVAAYTDIYFQYIPKNCILTTAEKLEGWMVSHLADKSVVKKKGWDIDEETPSAGRDAKFSWEVIRDNSIFTYHIDLVPGYAEIIAALKEEERLYKTNLAAESDSSSDSSDEDHHTGDEPDGGEKAKKPSTARKSHSNDKTRKSKSEKASNPFEDFKADGEDGKGEAAAEDGYNPFADFAEGA